MQLVIGLGNPGPRYAPTRHNLGYRVVDALAGRVDAVFARPHPAYLEARVDGPAGPVVLLKPLTFMNHSGRALTAWREAQAAADAPAPDAELLVVCDDLNLPLGALRIRAGGGAGGQKGLASVLDAAGTVAVPRVRLGVGPREVALDPAAWADYVLAPFAEAEVAAAAELVLRATDAVLDCLAAGPAAAAARHNRTGEPAGA